ncbi:MAG: hypothetical protein PHX83_03725 [Acidobacteriia bacterium]|nr:hypothetical protein [Terriglobia bacterium]
MRPIKRLAVILFVLAGWTGIYCSSLSFLLKSFAQASAPASATGQKSEPVAKGQPEGKPAGKSEKAKAASSSAKAAQILDETYQLALNAKPAVKVEILSQVANTMKEVDKTRAGKIYQTAFEATQELPADDTNKRAQAQSELAVGFADIDVESALALAMRVEETPPADKPDIMMSLFGRGNTNFRAQAIQQVASKVGEKDLSRAVLLILPTLQNRDFPFDAVMPLLMKLQRSAPDQANTLFGEMIRQFSAGNPSFMQTVMFATATRVFANVNSNLALEAVDAVLQKIPELEEATMKEMMKNAPPGSSPQSMPFSFGAIIKMALVPTLKKLDPARGEALEKEIKPQMESMDKMTGGMFSSGMNMDFDSSEPPEKQQQKFFDGLDPQKFPESQRGAMSNVMAMSLADLNPQKALAFAEYATDERQKTLALAAIAGGFASSDKERARSLLSDAASAAEKIKGKPDRAVIFTMLAESAVKIDRTLAPGFYATAFENYEQAFDELSQSVSSEKERSANTQKRKELSNRESRAIAGYANVNFDDAVERARRIGDERQKLLTLVQLARRILVPADLPSVLQFIDAPTPQTLPDRSL